MAKAVKSVVSAIVKIVKVIVQAIKFVVKAVVGFVKSLASGDPATWIMTIALILAGPAGWAILTWTQVAVMGAISILATEYQREKAIKLQSEAERELAAQKAEAEKDLKAQSQVYFDQMEEDRYNSYTSNPFGSNPVLTDGESWSFDDGTETAVVDKQSMLFPMMIIGGSALLALEFGGSNEYSKEY